MPLNLFAISLLVFLLHFYFHWQFLKHIAKHYPGTFKQIDSPKVFTKYHIQKTDAYSVFMFDKEWKAFNDNYLDRMHKLKQIFLGIAIVLFAAGVFLHLK